MKIDVTKLQYYNITWIFFRSIFSSINDVKLEETRAGPIEPTDEVGFPGSGGGLRSTTPHSRAKTSSVLSAQNRGETPPKIDKRLTQVYVSCLLDLY
jgi:hypothetical protein